MAVASLSMALVRCQFTSEVSGFDPAAVPRHANIPARNIRPLWPGHTRIKVVNQCHGLLKEAQAKNVRCSARSPVRRYCGWSLDDHAFPDRACFSVNTFAIGSTTAWSGIDSLQSPGSLYCSWPVSKPKMPQAGLCTALVEGVCARCSGF
jgi:hypothetical protein